MSIKIKRIRKNSIYREFSVRFSNCRYGWMGISLHHYDITVFYASISGVYNPFYDYVEMLENIKKTNNRTFNLFIDQEGFDGSMSVKVMGKFLELTTETLKDNLGKYDIEKNTIRISKKVFLKSMKMSLLEFYKKNKTCMNDDEFYDLSFPLFQLRKLKV